MKFCTVIALFFATATYAQSLDARYEQFKKQLQKTDTVASMRTLRLIKESVEPAAKVYEQLALTDAHLRNGDKQTAFSSALHALELAKNLLSDSLLFRAEHKTGVLYMSNNDLPHALPYFNRALLLERSVKNLNARINLLRDLALLYNYLDDNKRAIEFFRRAEPLIVASGNKKSLGSLYNNLGLCYTDLHDSAQARQCLEKSLTVRTQIQDSIGIAQSHNNLGSLYEAMGDHSRALDEYQLAFELRKKAHVSPTALIESRINIGKAHFGMGEMAVARQWLEDARTDAAKNSHLELERRADEQLLKIYAQTGEYRKAFELQTRYYFIQDSLYGLDKKEEINRISFEGRLREDSVKHAEMRQRDLALHAEREKQSAFVRNVVLAGFTLVLLVAFMLYKQVKRIRHANHLIGLQKQELETKQKEILDSIHYARRIQTSLLASESYIQRQLSKWQNSRSN